MSVQGALALLFFLSIGPPANAQDYPSKPIRVLLPFAGGTEWSRVCCRRRCRLRSDSSW
jgi:tripartite-type tricarboxylate transporter receptor subunit TctC